MPSAQRSKRVLTVVVSSLVLAAAIGIYFKTMVRDSKDAEREAAEAARRSRVSDELESALAFDERGLSRATVVLQTTRGRIRFKLFSGDAPNTSRRFSKLVLSGFYNGLVFHRVEPGFVIQGGDPTGTGEGGSGIRIPPEFNDRKHVPGSVAMARTRDPGSADSQFYISLGTHPRLDGRYTVFGQVIEGLEVVHQIQVGDRMTAASIEMN